MKQDTLGPTLVDCDCRARVHADGSGIELDYCSLHEAAQEMYDFIGYVHRSLGIAKDFTPEMARKQAHALIAKAEGRVP